MLRPDQKNPLHIFEISPAEIFKDLEKGFLVRVAYRKSGRGGVARVGTADTGRKRPASNGVKTDIITSMSSLPCDVVILPNDELANKAISASQKLAPLGGLFTLEIGKYFPHSSLFMLQLKEDDLEKVKSLLAEIASKTSVLNLKATGCEQKEAFVDVEYERNEQTDNLQRQVIEVLNPIRDGMREKDKARMLEATGIALENFQNYGYKFVGELFRPHITFTRFGETQPEPENLLPELSTFDGSFTKLGLFEMGDNGTCVRKIAEFELSGQIN